MEILFKIGDTKLQVVIYCYCYIHYVRMRFAEGDIQHTASFRLAEFQDASLKEIEENLIANQIPIMYARFVKWMVEDTEKWQMNKIVTRLDRPPVPTRKYDFSAHIEGYDLGDFIGYGETVNRAIDDLLDQEGEG